MGIYQEKVTILFGENLMGEHGMMIKFYFLRLNLPL